MQGFTILKGNFRIPQISKTAEEQIPAKLKPAAEHWVRAVLGSLNTKHLQCCREGTRTISLKNLVVHFKLNYTVSLSLYLILSSSTIK